VKIVVTVKQVPDPNAATTLEADNTLSREKEAVLDPGDECGIEEALQLKEAHGGEVILISMGPEKAKDAIRKGLSMGADRGVLITDPQLAGADVSADGARIGCGDQTGVARSRDLRNRVLRREHR